MSTKSEKIFQSLSSLNPCRLYIDTPVCKLAKNQLNSPQAAAAVTSQKIASGNLMSGDVWQQPHTQFLETLGVDRCILTLFVTQKA